MTIDACGDFYVIVMMVTIYRISTEGAAETAITLHAMGMVNAVNFGSGIGDWQAESIYVVSMSGGGFELPVGVPGACSPFTVIE